MRPPGAYPLQTLLRLRQEIRDQSRQILAEAVQRLQQAESAQHLAQKRLWSGRDRLSNERELLAGGGARRAQAFQLHQQFLERLQREVEHLEGLVHAASTELEACQQAHAEAQLALAGAQTELEVIEHNRESWDQARRADEVRRAEQELEDVVAARLARKEGP